MSRTEIRKHHKSICNSAQSVHKVEHLKLFYEKKKDFETKS
jgi:hypothetical protein